MALDEISIREAEAQLAAMERLSQQIDYARSEFRNRLERYRRDSNPVNEIDLLESAAFFEKHIRPFLTQRQISERRFLRAAEMITMTLDRRWQAYEFDHLFHGIDYLNKLYVIRDKLQRDHPDLRMRREMTRSTVSRFSSLYYYLAPYEELQVRSIQFASPGSINFGVIAQVVVQLKGMLHYLCTFQFVKEFVDLYDHFRYERPAQRAEQRIRLKELLQREQAQPRNAILGGLEDYRQFLSKMNEIADLATELERKGLANGQVVEETAMRCISMLHRLSFEQEKFTLSSQADDER